MCHNTRRQVILERDAKPTIKVTKIIAFGLCQRKNFSFIKRNYKMTQLAVKN